MCPVWVNIEEGRYVVAFREEGAGGLFLNTRTCIFNDCIWPSLFTFTMFSFNWVGNGRGVSAKPVAGVQTVKC